MANPFDQFDAQPAQAAPVAPPANPFDQFDAAQPDATPPQRGIVAGIGRQVGLTARAGMAGVGQLFDMFNNPANALVNMPAQLASSTPTQPLAYDVGEHAAQSAADYIGLPKPETGIERGVQTVGSSIVSTAGPGGLIRDLGTAARAVPATLRSIPQMLGESLTASPAADVALGAGAGAGQVAGEQGIGGDYGGTIGNIGGMILTAIGHHGVSAMAQRVREARAASGAPPEAVAAHVSPEEVSKVLTPDDVQRLAHANGITDPADPRIQALMNGVARPTAVTPTGAPAPAFQGLEAIRQQEAGIETRAPSSANATAMRTADEAMEAGANPAAVMPAAREPIGQVIVTPSGQALPLNPDGMLTAQARSTNEGLRSQGGAVYGESGGALVPTEPQVQRMTPGEIAQAQARAAATGQGAPADSTGRLFTDTAGTAAPWEHPTALLTHDPIPAEADRIPFRQAVNDRGEGNPAVNTDAPGSINVGQRYGALVPTEPQPTRLSDADVARMQAQNGRDAYTPSPDADRLFVNGQGVAAPWEHPAGLIGHDLIPSEESRIPFRQAVHNTEGNPAAGQNIPGNIHVRQDRELRPYDTKPPAKPGEPPAQGELAPVEPTPPPPWLRGGEAAPVPKPTEPAREPSAPRAEAPPAHPEGSPAPVEAPAEAGPGQHVEAWTKARDTAAARAQQLQQDAATLRDLREQRTNWNPEAPGAPAKMPGSDQYPAGVPGARALDAAIRGKERGAVDALGRQHVAEAALRGLETGQEPAFKPSYPKAADNQAVSTAAPTPPQGIIKTIQGMGGIRDPRGDLASQDLHRVPGLVNNRTVAAGPGKPAGIPLDQIADRLADRGFFPTLKAEMEHSPNARTLDGPQMVMDAINQERAGGRVVPQDDANAHAAAVGDHEQRMAALDGAAQRLGLAPDEVRGLTRGQLADMMAEQHSVEDLARIHAEQSAHMEAELEAAQRAHDEYLSDAGDLPVDWEREISRPATQEDIENVGHPADATGNADTADAARDAGTGGERGNPDVAEPRPAAGGESPLGERAGERAGGADRAIGADEEGQGRRAADAGSGQDAAPGEQGGEGRPAAEGRDALRRTVEDNGQAVLPGGEASTRQAIAARENAPLRGKGPQADMTKFDLFDPHARDQGSLAVDAAKGASDISGKLYGGPGAIFDPDAWKFLFGPIKKSVLRPFAESFTEMAEAFRSDSAKAKIADSTEKRAQGPGTPAISRADNALPRPARQINSALRSMFYGADSAMRAMADRLPAGSRTAMHEFLDLWHARAGEARGAAQTYLEGHTAQRSRMLNDLSKILKMEKPTSGAAAAAQRADMAQVVRMVQNPRSIQTGTRLGDMAAGVRDWLEAAHRYQTAAGVELGAVPKGYFPRRLDIMEITKNEPGFLAAAEKAFRDAGSNNARESAEAWLLHIKTNGADKGPIGSARDTLGGDHVNGRTLPKSADETLGKFLVSDPVQVLTNYANAAARQAEFARVMGKDNAAWTKLTKALQKDGAESALVHAADYVNTSTGAKNYFAAGPRAQKALAWVRLWGSMSFMEHSTITSLPEAFTAWTRTGNPADLGRQVKAMAGYWMGTKAGVRSQQLAEDVGTIVSHLGGSMAAARWVGDLGGDKQTALGWKYFRMNGLEQWSHGMNTGATAVGDHFVRAMARDVGAAGRPGREAGFALAELGIPKDKHAAFADWIKGATNGGKDQMTPALLASAPKDMAQLYRTGVFRFSRQVHMQPNAATRPGWASSPLGAMAFHLSNYAYAIHTNVLMRAARMMKDGDLTGADKLVMGAKIAMGMMATVVASRIIGDARQALIGSDAAQPNYDKNAWELALSRGQMLGAVDPWYQIYSGARYSKELGTSVLGPAAGRVAGAASTALGFMQDDKNYKHVGQHTADVHTVSSERKVAQAAYDTVLKPAAAAVSSFLPAPVGAAVLQYMGAGQNRDGFASKLAGPAPKAKH